MFRGAELQGRTLHRYYIAREISILKDNNNEMELIMKIFEGFGLNNEKSKYCYHRICLSGGYSVNVEKK